MDHRVCAGLDRCTSRHPLRFLIRAGTESNARTYKPIHHTGTKAVRAVTRPTISVQSASASRCSPDTRTGCPTLVKARSCVAYASPRLALPATWSFPRHAECRRADAERRINGAGTFRSAREAGPDWGALGLGRSESWDFIFFAMS